MRVSREQAAVNRDRIVDAAARLFRDKGFDGAGVDAIMNEAGLTHGGFYGHFASKEALLSEAMTHAFARSDERQRGARDLGSLVSDYLSERHRAHRANGCAVAALGCDFGRQAPVVRRTLSAAVRRQIDRLAGLLKRGTAATRRRRAIATYAGMVGTLMLARAVDDPALAGEILLAGRQTFGTELP